MMAIKSLFMGHTKYCVIAFHHFTLTWHVAPLLQWLHHLLGEIDLSGHGQICLSSTLELYEC